MASQQQRYKGILEALGQQKEREGLHGALLCLQHLCRQTQNPPPDGCADGSVGPATFVELRDLATSLRLYLQDLDRALEATDKESP